MIYNICLLLLFLFLILQCAAAALLIEPGTVFIVGDTNYTVDRPVDFSKIVINDSWIMFNDFNFSVINQTSHIDVVISNIDEYSIKFNATGEAWMNVIREETHMVHINGYSSFNISEYPMQSTIEVESKNVIVNQSFVLNITCYQQEPIKAWELKIRFDPSVLSANFVSEGDFFDGYETFFISGIIDNVNGTITNIYDLIVGDGNISSSGILLSINFTANAVGNAEVSIYDFGICNETQYLFCTAINGYVTISDEYDIELYDEHQEDTEYKSLGEVVVIITVMIGILAQIYLWLNR